MVLGKCPILWLCISISSFPGTICWKHSFPHWMVVLLKIWLSVKGLFLDSLVCSIGIGLRFYGSTSFEIWKWDFLCFVSVQSLSHVQVFLAPWTAASQASLSIINSWSLLKLMSIESVMPCNHLTLCHPLLPLSSIFPSIRVFSNESALHRWPKYWSFSFNISSSNEHSGLISFRMDWFDLLAVQGTLKSLLQHHSSKALTVLWHSAFFIIQLSHLGHDYLTFVGKVMSLLFNILSSFNI